MIKKENVYTIQNLSKLAKVSVRTLRHYDHIGLLTPISRTEGGHRVYGENELLRLQQVLFYKELDLSLDEIKIILDDPDFDIIKTLESHKKSLQNRQERLTELIDTVDKTILFIRGNDMTNLVTDEDLYKGFESKEQAKEYMKEAKERWGDQYAQSMKNIKGMTKVQFEMVKKEGGDITQAIANIMNNHKPTDPEVVELMARYHKHIETFYKCSGEMFKGLGEMYLADSRFTAFYEKIKPGLALFMKEAMANFADTKLS